MTDGGALSAVLAAWKQVVSLRVDISSHCVDIYLVTMACCLAINGQVKQWQWPDGSGGDASEPSHCCVSLY